MTNPYAFEVFESPDHSVIEIHSDVDPISLQASVARKNKYRGALSAAVAQNTSRLFVHDVTVSLVWVIAEERRYRTHIVADLDNILKPSIDALVGPTGVMIDDNQVQSIQASWNTGLGRSEGFMLRVESLGRGDYLPRGGRFVEIATGQCFYVPPMGARQQKDYVGRLVEMNAKREELIALGARQDLLWAVTPLARSFPRARLGKFEILSPNGF